MATLQRRIGNARVGALLRRSPPAGASTARLQRSVEVDGTEYGGQTGNLSQLVDVVFPTAATSNRGEVDQVLTRFDFQDRSFASRTELVLAVNRELAHDAGGQAREVPRLLHHFWAGGKLSSTAYHNLVGWAQAAEGTGWTQYVMTDWEINKLFRDEDLPMQLESLSSMGAVIVDVSQLPVGRSPAYQKLKRELFQTRSKSKLPYLSDLARYAQIDAMGGTYVDADVGPGSVDLTQPVSVTGDVPMLGPGFRTTRQARDEGALSEDAAVREGAKLGMFGRDKLAIGNHFISAPAGNPYVRMANAIATRNVLEHSITNGGIDFLKAFNEMGGNVTDQVAASIPAWLQDVDWVTDESDSTVD